MRATTWCLLGVTCKELEGQIPSNKSHLHHYTLSLSQQKDREMEKEIECERQMQGRREGETEKETDKEGGKHEGQRRMETETKNYRRTFEEHI